MFRWANFSRRQRQKAQASLRAQHQEEIDDGLQAEKDVDLENGEFDQWNAEALREETSVSSAQASPRSGLSASTRLKAKTNAYVCRSGRFILAKKVSKLIEGEQIYRLRRRKFGQAERFVPWGTVVNEERKTSND